jgi:hypothetical protein
MVENLIMKTMEIYFRDLTPDAQKRFNRLFGEPETFNHAIAPLAIYEQEDEGEGDNPHTGGGRGE